MPTLCVKGSLTECSHGERHDHTYRCGAESAYMDISESSPSTSLQVLYIFVSSFEKTTEINKCPKNDVFKMVKFINDVFGKSAFG